MRRLGRILGTVMIVSGLLSIGWALLVWQWQDPFTALYTKYEQHKLASSYPKRLAEYRLPEAAPSSLPSGQGPSTTDPAADERRQVAIAARAYRESLREGEPVGRLIIPRLGLKIIIVNGTTSGTLQKGPGRELHTFMPGEGELIYIAGHRTTYGAPFAHIDKLRPGDRVTLELPYATFEYEITEHRIVTAQDLSVLQSKHREVVALQACHPRFFATHRWIAYAKPVRVVPRDREPYAVGGAQAPVGVGPIA